MADNDKSEQAKATWDNAKELAELTQVGVREARSILAKNPNALDEAKAKDAPTKAKKKAKPSTKATDTKATVEKDLQKLKEKYPHVKGDLQSHREGPHKNRRTVTIICSAPDCTKERTVATCDLFQVKHCEECAIKLRKAKRRKAGKSKEA